MIIFLMIQFNELCTFNVFAFTEKKGKLTLVLLITLVNNLHLQSLLLLRAVILILFL